MEINVIPCPDNISHVHLKGHMDPHRTQQIGRQFREETLGRSRPVVVDMSDVTFITSVGIGLLVECATMVSQGGHAFVLVSPVGHVDQVLRRTGIYDIITNAPSVDDAFALVRYRAE